MRLVKSPNGTFFFGAVAHKYYICISYACSIYQIPFGKTHFRKHHFVFISFSVRLLPIRHICRSQNQGFANLRSTAKYIWLIFLKNGLYKILKLVEVRGWCKLNISVAVKTPWQYLGIGLKRSYIWKSYNTRVATLKWITSHLFPLNFKFSQASHQGRIESELI